MGAHIRIEGGETDERTGKDVLRGCLEGEGQERREGCTAEDHDGREEVTCEANREHT